SALEEKKRALVDDAAGAASLAQKARELSEQMAGIRGELAGVDDLLGDYGARRDREEQSLYRYAKSAWVSQVAEALSKWEQSQFDLCGLLGAGLVDVQGKLVELCRRGMIEWYFRNLAMQAEIEVKPIVLQMEPRLSILSMPVPSRVGVQVPGASGRTAVAVV